jgi:uncharacterized Fe-S center protein
VEVHIMASTVYFVGLRAENEHSTVLGRLKTCARKLLEGRLSSGDLVAVKLHFGERGNHGFIRPVFVRAVVEVVRELGGKPFLTDTNTLYTGFRHNAFDHLETALFHGFGYPAVPAPLVIADGLRGKDHREVEVHLKHFRKVTVASAIQEADFLLVMTHVKGHIEAGLGGAIKNVGMGCASRVGKQMQHGGTFLPGIRKEKCIGCRRCILHCPQGALFLDEHRKAGVRPELCIGCAECLLFCPTGAIDAAFSAKSELLQERMVEYAFGTLKEKGEKVAFLNFLLDISPDCDCAPWHDASIVPDIGILGSFDIVAIDQASADLINRAWGLENSKLGKPLPPGEDKLSAVHPTALWQRQIDYATAIGLGSKAYVLEEV